jgi:hypothetical protein
VARSQYDHIFGGYTSVPWDNAGGKIKDDSAFLFSVTDQKKFEVTPGEVAVYHLDNEGPSFFDLWF